MHLSLLPIAVQALALGAVMPGPPGNQLLSSSFGVSVHDVTDGDLNEIASAGFKTVRVDMRWQRVEVKKGVYDWSYYKALADKLRSRGLRPMFVLGYGNALYSFPKGERAVKADAFVLPPTEPSAIAAYSRWAAAAAAEFSAYDPIWEIWNEPNAPALWPPKPNVREYNNLANSACRAIRSVDASAMVTGPGLSHVIKDGIRDVLFLKNFLSMPASRCFSTVSLHPYLSRSLVDDTATYWRSIRGISALSKPLDPPQEFIVSETGIADWGGVTEDEQASYLVKTYIINAENRIPITVWYDWKNDGTDRKNPQHNFGLITNVGADKKSILAFRFMAKYLGGLEFRCKISSGAIPHLYVFSSSGEGLSYTRGVVWAKIPSTTKALRPPAGAKSIVDMYGRAGADNEKIGSYGHPTYVELSGNYRNYCG